MIRIEYEAGGTLRIADGDKIYEGNLDNIRAFRIEIPDTLNFMNYSKYDDGSVECWWNGEKTEDYPKDFTDSLMESLEKITSTMNYYFVNAYPDSEEENFGSESDTGTLEDNFDEMSDTEYSEPSPEDIYRTWIASHLNEKAYELGFQSFDEAVTFSTSSVKTLKEKAKSLETLRDGMYVVLIDVVSRLRSGELETAPELDEFIEMLNL